ncbi:MAG: Rpn family recombination-promoting nuclease/putative transposase [Syntrophomonadaceae bacterium]|nr:Rpn family recombination-promoting nuclease/putative transposase [Syntrophomonadaceae bacterium]
MKYLQDDLSRYSDDEIKGEAINRIATTIMRDIFTKDNKGLLGSLFRAVSYLLELDDKQTTGFTKTGSLLRSQDSRTA